MVRQLDLKKPPSIAESIDWARTLLLVGADDIDRETFEQSMSIIVKHRSDIDLVAERVAVKLGGRRPAPAEQASGMSAPRQAGRVRPRPGRRRKPARLLRGPALRGRRGRHLGDPRRVRGAGAGELDRPARLPRGARLDHRQVPGGPPGLRAAVRPPLLPRRRGGGAGARAAGGALRGLRAARPGRAARGDSPGDPGGQRRRDARPGAARDHRLRPPRRALRRDRRRRAAHPPRARAAGPGRWRRRRSARARPGGGAPIRAAPAPRAGAGDDRAHRQAAALAAAGRARPHSSHQPHPGPGRGAPRGRPAEAPDRHPGPRAAGAQQRADRGRAPHDALLAGDRRRAAAAALPAEAPAATRDLRPLRRLDLRQQRQRLLPLGAARAARLVPQAAQLRLHRAHQRGHRHLRARARLPGDLGAGLVRRWCCGCLGLHRLRARLARVRARRSPRSSARARP